MAASNHKKQILVICGIAAVISAAAVGGGFYAQTLVEEVEAKITSQKQAVQVAEAKIAKIPSVEREVVILRENLGEYVKILPDDKELTDFVRMLHQFEQQSGGESSKLTIGKGNKGSKLFAMIEYSFEMEATLWEMMRFVNLVENYDRFVNITEFSIIPAKVGSSGQEITRDGDAVHGIRLTMQTYQYKGQAVAKEVEIPKYEDLRVALHDEILRRMQAIRIEKYEHRGRQGRRDVFVDPRFRGDPTAEGFLSLTEQHVILERFVAEVTKLKEMLERVRKQDTTLFEQYALEKGLRKGIAAIETQIESEAAKITYSPYRMQWSKEVVSVVEDLRKEVDDVAAAAAADPYLPIEEMQGLVAQMKNDCENGFLEEARQRYESIAPKLQVPEGDPRHDLAVEAKSWHNKIVTAIDFRGMDINIEGVVVDRRGRSGVLLNGQVYEEGELVSEELLVKMVEEEQVWFVFRGLTLVRTL